MMSVITLHATGKEDVAGIVNYSMGSVCDDEAQEKGMKGATVYYAEGGIPAGHWMGDGLAGLGNASASLSTGDKVEAIQLLDLIGDMVDPLLVNSWVGNLRKQSIPRHESSTPPGVRR